MSKNVLLPLVCGVGALVAGYWFGRENHTNRETPALTHVDFKQGKFLYQQHCQRCHGEEGKGDGPQSGIGRVPPRDFAQSNWKYGANKEAIARVIRLGIPGSVMLGTPGLASAEVDAITQWVLKLAERNEEGIQTQAKEAIRAAGFRLVSGGESARHYKFATTKGHEISFSDKLGKPTILYFWRCDCVPCLKKLPELAELSHSLTQINLIPICVSNDQKEFQETVNKHGAGENSLRDQNGKAALLLGVESYPTVILLNADGLVIGKRIGSLECGGKELNTLAIGLKKNQIAQ